MQRQTEFVANGYGIAIPKRCATCAHKGQTRLMTRRHCLVHDKEVKPKNVCSLWQMSSQMKAAGLGGGKVKRREYLKYLALVRGDENIAKQNGLKIMPKSVDAIRREFEQEHGSIYINI